MPGSYRIVSGPAQGVTIGRVAARNELPSASRRIHDTHGVDHRGRTLHGDAAWGLPPVAVLRVRAIIDSRVDSAISHREAPPGTPRFRPCLCPSAARKPSLPSDGHPGQRAADYRMLGLPSRQTYICLCLCSVGSGRVLNRHALCHMRAPRSPRPGTMFSKLSLGRCTRGSAPRSRGAPPAAESGRKAVPPLS
jgi:hypothetical protein